MKKVTYVIGHKNPDTDAIVSAIAYAEYKNLSGNLNVVAGRIGPISDDTEYLLERFRFEEPIHLYSAKSNVNEIDYDKAVLISPSITIKEALSKIINTDTRTVFITDKKKKLLGLISLSNLNKLWTANEKYLSKLLKTASLENIVRILKAKTLVKASSFKTNGVVELAPSEDDAISKNSIIITSSTKRFREAIKAKASLIIIVGKADNFIDLLPLAEKADINVIQTSFNALKVSKLIYQTPTIDHIMMKEDEVIKILIDETVDSSLNKVSKSRYRSYPIIDENKAVVGALSRYHLINYKKKRFILVDHNESKQSIDDIDAGEVIEIVDHHRFGGFESTNPIKITTMVVGATATIITNMFLENKIKIEKNLAGLLLGAVLSDTMNFKSPTTTILDKKVAAELEKISGVNGDELYKEIVKHGKPLSNRRSIDILYDDYKSYDINGLKVGISQATCKDKEELLSVKDSLKIAMEEACKTRDLDLIICMLTDPNGSGSYLLSCGDKENIIEEMYPNRKENNFVVRLMSRKKQLLPEVIKVLS